MDDSRQEASSEAAEHHGAPPDLEAQKEDDGTANQLPNTVVSESHENNCIVVDESQKQQESSEAEQNVAPSKSEAQNGDQPSDSQQHTGDAGAPAAGEATTGTEAATEAAAPEGHAQATGDQLPGYQEACVIAANNLRELDLKAYTVRLQRKFTSSSLWQIVASLILVIIETFEIIFLNPGGCYGAGVWTGGLLVLTGVASVALSRMKCFREGLFRKVAWLEVLALLCAFASFILFIRHWMNSTNQSNLYVAFQVIHIGKLALCVLDFVVVVSKLYFFYRFDFYYRDFRSSTGNSNDTSNAVDTFNTIASAQMRNASLSTIFDELERNSNNDEDARYIEPPPDYDRVVAAQPGRPAEAEAQQEDSQRT